MKTITAILVLLLVFFHAGSPDKLSELSGENKMTFYETGTTHLTLRKSRMNADFRLDSVMEFTWMEKVALPPLQMRSLQNVSPLSYKYFSHLLSLI